MRRHRSSPLQSRACPSTTSRGNWPVKNKITKVLAKHLHPDSVYQGIVKHDGGMVGTNADVHVSACMRFVLLPPPMPWIIRRILPRCRNGWDTRISQRPACMTAASTGQRTRRHLRWSINGSGEGKVWRRWRGGRYKDCYAASFPLSSKNPRCSMRSNKVWPC
jgi:hypothetical protein